MKKVFRRSLSWLLSVVMVFGLFVVPASLKVSATQSSSSFNTSYSLNGNSANDIVAVANAQIGKNGSSLGYSEQWCADFVCDCAKYAKISDSIIPHNYSGRGACTLLYNRMIGNCGAKVVSSAQPGDIIFWGQLDDFSHVGIVVNSTNAVSGNNSTTYPHDLYLSTVKKYGFDQAGDELKNWVILRPNYDNRPLDTISPTITNARAENVSGDSFTIKCTLSDNVGVTRVWLVIYGPSGEKQFGVSASNGEFSYTIKTSDYGGSGEYAFHLYAFDAAENSKAVAVENIHAVSDNEKPVISNAKAVNCSDESFTVQCDLSDNVGVTRVWLNIYGPGGSNGYGLEASNGFFSHTIKTADYGGSGDYTVHIYAFDAEGNETPCAINGIKTYVDYGVNYSLKSEFNGHTYEYYDYPLKWFDAYRFCEKKGGHLVTITSKEENDFLSGLVQDFSVWTGGKTFDNSPWMWITGEDFKYQNWGQNQPDNYNDSEDALQYVFNQTTTYWNDAPRDTILTFICEYDNIIDASKYTPVYKTKYNGHEYWYFENIVDWQTAKKICEAKGGYLAIPDNANENDMLISGLKNTSNDWIWIGITDIETEGVWKDVKGKVIQFTNWSYPQPDNYGGREDYVHMYGDGSWNDANCGCNCCNNVGFVCEFDDLCTGSGHDYKLTSQTAATCTADGEKVYTCSRCGDTKTEKIDKTGHNYTPKVVEPTCTEKGYTLHTCTNCGDSFKDTYTDALGHDYTDTVVAPTKTEKGYTLHTCTRCGDSYKDNYTDPITDVAAESLTLDKSTVDVNVGQLAIVTATVKPENATDKNVTWTSTDNTIATVTDGVIKGVKAGQTVVIAKTTNGLTAYVIVNVKADSTPLANNSTISATKVTTGTKVTLTGKASGGAGDYTYALMYKKHSSSTWIKIGEKYTTVNKGSFTPKTATTYDVRIIVKDGAGKTVKKEFTLTVTAANTALTNKSTVSATEVKKGTKVTLTAKATGGTAPYTYALMYKKSSSSTWTKIGTKYGTASTGSFKPGSATTYDIMINVKDNTGKVKSKTFTLTVK